MDGDSKEGFEVSGYFLPYLEFSEAEQKQNPDAAVRAIKFYATSMQGQNADKFMLRKSVYSSDDDKEDFLNKTASRKY